MERLFSDLLAEHARGRTNLEVTRQLREAVKTAMRLGRKAEITIKIGIADAKGEVDLTIGVASKLPNEAPDYMQYFLGLDGLPVAENPHQTNIGDLIDLEATSGRNN